MKEAVISVNGSAKVSLTPSVRIEPSLRWVRVKFNDEVVADSKRAIYVWADGHMVTYYFPSEDVRTDWLQPSRQGGDGKQYYDLTVGDETAPAVAWDYPSPSADQEPLRGYITLK